MVPFQVVNIGNSTKVRLEDFLEAIKAAAGTAGTRFYMGMQRED